MPTPFQTGDHKERPYYTQMELLHLCIVGAGLAPRPATLLNRLQVQENILDVWIFRGPGSGIGVLRSGPADELGGAVLIPVGFTHQRVEGQFVNHNLLRAVYRLLVHLLVSAPSL